MAYATALPLECAQLVSEDLDASEYHCDREQSAPGAPSSCNFECMPHTCRVMYLEKQLKGKPRLKGA